MIREYIKPSLDLKLLFKRFYKGYQFFHHSTNWKICPQSIIYKVQGIVKNIKVPKALVTEHRLSYNYSTAKAYCEFYEDLERISLEYTNKLQYTCSNFFDDNTPEFWTGIEHFTSKQIVLALIMTKIWAKKNYRKIDHELIESMCELVSQEGIFNIQYINNYIVDLTDNNSSNSIEYTEDTPQDSMDPHNTQDIQDTPAPPVHVIPKQCQKVSTPKVHKSPSRTSKVHSPSRSYASAAQGHTPVSTVSFQLPYPPYTNGNAIEDSGFDSFLGNSSPNIHTDLQPGNYG